MHCLLCKRPCPPDHLFDAPLCQAAYVETMRLRFAEPDTPPGLQTLIDRWAGGVASASEQDEVLRYLRRPHER